MYALQLQNVKRNTVKKLDINQLNSEKEEFVETETKENEEVGTTNIDNLQVSNDPEE
jgi:hypothetical protein